MDTFPNSAKSAHSRLFIFILFYSCTTLSILFIVYKFVCSFYLNVSNPTMYVESVFIKSCLLFLQPTKRHPEREKLGK